MKKGIRALTLYAYTVHVKAFIDKAQGSRFYMKVSNKKKKKMTVSQLNLAVTPGFGSQEAKNPMFGLQDEIL